MTKTLSFCLAAALAWAPCARADQGAPAAAATGTTSSDGKSAWQTRYSDAKATTTTLFVVGGVSLIAGGVLVAAGSSDVNDARNTPGCSISGNTITCYNQSATNEAQSKLDSGKSKLTTGLLLAAVLGGGFLTWGGLSLGKLSRLKKQGRREGYLTFDVNPGRDREVRLAYVQPF
jgi:hypothetical protein